MKPTEIVKVKGCDEGCPFTDWTEPCGIGGNKWAKGDKPYPHDCPLLTKNIQVELEK